MRIALLLLCSLPCFGAWSNGYTYRYTVTIDHTKVPNTDQTNFPVLINETIATWATSGSGGNVLNTATQTVGAFSITVPADFIVTSDAAGSTQIAGWEFESYTAATGATILWMNIASVSHTSDTIYYIFVGKTTVTTLQMTTTATWNSNFAGVWHFPNGSSLTAADSTSNARNGTINSVVAGAGQIDGAIDTNTTTGNNVTATSATVSPTLGTISAWVKFNYNSPAAGFPVLWDTVTGRTYLAGNAGISHLEMYTDGRDSQFNTNYVSGTYYHVVMAYNKTGNVHNLYWNAVAQTDVNPSGTWGSSAAGTFHMTDKNTSANPCNCAMDEVHSSSVLLSADWVTTEYNNQSDPTGFTLISAAETNVGTPVVHRAISQ